MTRATTVLTSLLALGVVSIAADADAQQLRYSTTAPGGIAATGNTLGLAKGQNVNGPGTEHSIGAFISLDPNSVDDDPTNATNPWPFGTTWDWTQNGSAAELRLPQGAQVLHAELVWAGSYDYYPENVLAYIDTPVSLLAGSETIDVTPDPSTAQTLEEQSYTGFWANYYLRSADVTSFVAKHGATMYAVSGVPATQGDMTNTLSGAGWSLVVAYRHSMSPIRNLTVFVGGSFVDEDSSQDYAVSGFCAPPYGAVEGNAIISALEGDANLTGEDLAIGETEQGSFLSLSGPNNPESNFFCSQINDENGQLDTSGSFGSFNHDPFTGENVAGARQGWDLTTVALSSASGHLRNDQKSAVLRTTTVGDSYFPVLVALELDVKAPDFGDSMTQADKPVVTVGDELTVTTTLANTGQAEARELVLSLPIDGGLDLIDFTMDAVSGDANGQPVTEAGLGSGIDAGVLPVNKLTTIELKLKVVAPPDNGVEYVFAPEWSHSFVSCSTDPAIQEGYTSPTTTVQYQDNGNEPEQPEPEQPEPTVPGVGIEDPIEEGGCACTTPGGQGSSAPAGGLALMALAAAVGLRRRRR